MDATRIARIVELAKTAAGTDADRQWRAAEAQKAFTNAENETSNSLRAGAISAGQGRQHRAEITASLRRYAAGRPPTTDGTLLENSERGLRREYGPDAGIADRNRMDARRATREDRRDAGAFRASYNKGDPQPEWGHSNAYVQQKRNAAQVPTPAQDAAIRNMDLPSVASRLRSNATPTARVTTRAGESGASPAPFRRLDTREANLAFAAAQREGGQQPRKMTFEAEPSPPLQVGVGGANHVGITHHGAQGVVAAVPNMSNESIFRAGSSEDKRRMSNWRADAPGAGRGPLADERRRGIVDKINAQREAGRAQAGNSAAAGPVAATSSAEARAVRLPTAAVSATGSQFPAQQSVIRAAQMEGPPARRVAPAPGGNAADPSFRSALSTAQSLRGADGQKLQGAELVKAFQARMAQRDSASQNIAATPATPRSAVSASLPSQPKTPPAPGHVMPGSPSESPRNSNGKTMRISSSDLDSPTRPGVSVAAPGQSPPPPVAPVLPPAPRRLQYAPNVTLPTTPVASPPRPSGAGQMAQQPMVPPLTLSGRFGG